MQRSSDPGKEINANGFFDPGRIAIVQQYLLHQISHEREDQFSKQGFAGIKNQKIYFSDNYRE